jgi:hypothetical protein
LVINSPERIVFGVPSQTRKIFLILAQGILLRMFLRYIALIQGSTENQALHNYPNAAFLQLSTSTNVPWWRR